MQFLRGLFVVLGLATLAACGGDSFADQCKDGCSEEDCDGNKPTDSETSACESACERVDNLNDVSGCKDKADDAVSECDDVDACDDSEPSQACSDAARAYVECINDFCTDNSDNSACSDLQ